ncbi:MAG: DUF6527 family protein [Thiobacillus sp.]|nr:DUF6527 family protein [Thiobacillus sp.]
MGKLSDVLRNGIDNGLLFWCPGCDMAHGVNHGSGTGPRWRWNGNVDKPTFSPSVLVTWTQWVPPATDPETLKKIDSGEIVQREEPRVCHSFVTDGRIQFLGDCTHHLAGQTVDLPPFDDGWD